MFNQLVCLCLAAVITVCYSNDCTGETEGSIAEMGCWGYKKCEGNEIKEYPCEEGKVLERDSLTCVTIGSNLTACGQTMDCQGNVDGMYADFKQDCSSFYSCFKKEFRGRYYCQQGLVFDDRLSACNYKAKVPPPCGTFVEDETTTISSP